MGNYWTYVRIESTSPDFFCCLCLCFCVLGFHLWCTSLCVHKMANMNNIRGYDGCPTKFMSWNVKSLNHPVKFKKIFSRLKQLGVDIAFLQETHIRSCDSSRLVRGWAGQVYQSNFCSKARGVAIMIGRGVQFTASHVQADSAGRYVIVVGKLYSLPVILACIYAPNWDDPTFFTKFFLSFTRYVFTSSYTWW